MPTLQQQAIAYTRRWFKRQGRKAFEFQEETWKAFLDGEHGLVHAATGTGKTMAAFCGSMIQWLAENREAFRALKNAEKLTAASETVATLGQTKALREIPPPIKRTSIDRLNRAKTKRRKLPKLNATSKIKVLWVTPLRALATDTATNLGQAIDGLGLPWQVETRTGDSDPAVRSRQRKRFPEVLVTTPESLTLMLSWPGNLERFDELRLIVVDEWHELLGSKRGVQTELALARIRNLQPAARVWGLSATIGNLDEAMQVLCGVGGTCPGRLIRGRVRKATEIDSIIPPDIERFPWAGHLGLRLTPQVAKIVATAESSLVFTNTRSQTEFWYRALLNHSPDLAGRVAVHHGSLDRGLRSWVEDSLRDGKLKCCVCTASLDLGVDFTVVDQVVQIGSPKGNARLLQRAGRSGHQPGVASRITFVPTNAMELVELAAVRDSIAAGKIESRTPLAKPLDVLAQHVVTVALGSQFAADDLLNEVKSTHAYRDLSQQEWQWVLDFAHRGGDSLHAYPDFHRLENIDGQYVVTDKKVARKHRLSIGTIVSDSAIYVRYQKGSTLGMVEDSFVGRMEPGDKFMLAGKLLELVRVHENVAYVKRGKGKTTTIPRWMGGRLPLSNELSRSIREKLEQAHHGDFASAEMQSVRPLLELQSQWSAIPTTGQLLIERLKTRDGFHVFIYPFDGRLVHEGLAALLALRLSRRSPISFSMAMNDYGLVLQSPTDSQLGEALEAGLFSPDKLTEDIFESLNATEMTKRQFREIARVAGLIFEGYPGRPTSSRHLRASSNLFFDVFTQYDPNNLLLQQARREVLERQLEQSRLVGSLNRINRSEIVIRDLVRPTPFSFPLIVDGLRDRLSSEKLADRIERMQKSLEKEAG